MNQLLLRGNWVDLQEAIDLHLEAGWRVVPGTLVIWMWEWIDPDTRERAPQEFAAVVLDPPSVPVALNDPEGLR